MYVSPFSKSFNVFAERSLAIYESYCSIESEAMRATDFIGLRFRPFVNDV